MAEGVALTEAEGVLVGAELGLAVVGVVGSVAAALESSVTAGAASGVASELDSELKATATTMANMVSAAALPANQYIRC